MDFLILFKKMIEEDRMADVKTHLRELSVATTIGLLYADIEFKREDFYNAKCFLSYAKRVISNDISSARNLADYVIFSDDLKIIIDNGYKLGVEIYKNPYFNIAKNVPIKWLGNDTQKGDPIDISVGEYGFSLKEESFILKNMGLYQLLNNLTGSEYPRGLHIFNQFAQEEYDLWFAYTWNFLIRYLGKYNIWKRKKGENVAKIYRTGNYITLSFNSESVNVPVFIKTNNEYKEYTTSKIREKVFAKWIKYSNISDDANYICLKKNCSITAGKRICNQINSEFCEDNLYDFFRIYQKEYYYAKTTSTETTILKVPARKNFHSVIEFKGCRYEVPESQLNIISTFQNKRTRKILEFRNECRFSHGQFNGTPEAKMYVVRNTPLVELYEPVN